MALQKADGISWCDETINPWHGCSRVHGSPACEDPEDPTRVVCYAERDVIRFGYSDKPGAAHFPIWGPDAQRRFFGDKPFERIAEMNRKWAGRERRGRAFIMSFGDWAEGRPDQRPYLVKLWAAIAAAENVNFLMLTKRPQLIRTLCPYTLWDIKIGEDILPQGQAAALKADEVVPRVWQGTTVENKKWLDIRWPLLRQYTPFEQILWLSIEPQVEGFDLPQDFLERGKRAWVVVGGQSGAGATYFDPKWPRRFRDQCREAGVPFHMKQMSGRTKAELKAIPEDLFIRQFPDTLIDSGACTETPNTTR